MDTALVQRSGVFTDGSNNKIVSVDELFHDGTFVDYRTIPIINSDQTKLRVADRYFQFLSIAVVNWAWRQQGAYIACYPMPESICT